ncbi:MAG: bifunctional 5,10-methylenetetrahydrofolate dehydrogenase/5,10-methenyltetrahydrofolate cyclohydrolase [Elusimicrobia bacterium]|nr:bifunctional 5,10-methylenetetrahydrofolate dehydrogenase/5,10-methenyltetrahydrofolate cyclohydrolase [Elusimicrobiota bacterium]
MTAVLMEGKTLSREIKNSASEKIKIFREKKGRFPHLAAVVFKGDYSSDVYVKKEISACAGLGITADLKYMEEGMRRTEFIKLLNQLSADDKTDAVLVPRPVPKEINSPAVWEHVPPAKDIDGASTINMGRLFYCKSFDEIISGKFFVPCTALAVIKLLNYYNIDVRKGRTVVVGRSSTVGRPLAHMLSCMDATVSLCHSKTANIAQVMRSADILISAVGSPRWVKADMVKEGAIVVDVGTNADESGAFCGDVDFNAVKEKASFISPVPGGVGPVTLSCLIENIANAGRI